jgi:hypothetical protein
MKYLMVLALVLSGSAALADDTPAEPAEAWRTEFNAGFGLGKLDFKNDLLGQESVSDGETFGLRASGILYHSCPN